VKNNTLNQREASEAFDLSMRNAKTNISRFKLMFGNRFRSRQLESQKKELDVKSFLMNMISQKGMVPRVKPEKSAC